MEKFEKHPAYKQEDLEIKTEQELKAAKKAAGVTTHKEAVEKLEISEMGEKTREIISLFKEVFGHQPIIEHIGIEELGTEKAIEIRLEDYWENSTNYIAYDIDDPSKDKIEIMPPLTGGIGIEVGTYLSPEEIVREFQKIIQRRDELIKSGYEIKPNEDSSIYELEFSKIINNLNDLKNNLKKLKDIMENKE